MSHSEEEDGMGFSGLVPSLKEKREDAERARADNQYNALAERLEKAEYKLSNAIYALEKCPNPCEHRIVINGACQSRMCIWLADVLARVKT